MKSQGTFCEHSLTFLIGTSALALVAHEHQREAHQQQPTAAPRSEARCCPSARWKDLPAADIGIGVLKAARERDEHGRMERVGHLPVKSGFEVQVARLLCVFLRAGTQTHSL